LDNKLLTVASLEGGVGGRTASDDTLHPNEKKVVGKFAGEKGAGRQPRGGQPIEINKSDRK